MQEIAWYITLVLIGLLAVIFIGFIASSTDHLPYDDVARRDYRHRGKLLWLALIGGVAVTAATLTPWPHPVEGSAAPAKVIDVKASQWRWQLSDRRLRVGEAVEFRVRSEDVNHGFGIYDAAMNLRAQVQAMPGYTNTLRTTFNQPGEYQILCMEYCGVAHHDMRASLTVLPANQKQ